MFASFLLFMVPSGATADVTYSGNYAFGLYKNFYTTDEAQTWISCAQAPCFDPTFIGPDGRYTRIYVVNDSTTGTNQNAGLYSIDIYNETVSGRLAMGAPDAALEHTQDCVVDGNGDAYVIYDYTPSVWKVTDPSGVATETQMLGNYGDTGLDDDPFNIDMVPAGYNVGGATYEVGVDLVLFDNGLDDNNWEAISVIDKTSTAAVPVYTTDWSNNGTVGLNATCNEVDGYAYAAHYGTGSILPTDTVGTEILPYLCRTKSDGVLERVFLNDASMALEIDNSLECNPADGSLWMPIREVGTQDHIYYRIDVVNATSLGGGDFLAELSAEIVIDGDDGYNVVTNGFGISPDGRYLAVCAADARDQLYVYIIPEPATMALLGLGGMLLIRRKKR